MERVRVCLYSNWDCMNSHWLESSSGYAYEAGYFGDMVDMLNLNPKKLYKELRKVMSCQIYRATFVDKPERNGQEYVGYEEFARELVNSVGGSNLLTFVGQHDFDEAPCHPTTTIIPKGTPCGLFDSWNGSGSIMGMTLLRDLKTPVISLEANNYNPVFGLQRDEEYSTGQVYGKGEAFYKNIIKQI